MLLAVPSKDEVKQVVLIMNPHFTPGPDEFTGLFIALASLLFVEMW